jgi:hypothetical protein
LHYPLREYPALRMTGFAVITKMKNVASGEREPDK